MGMSGYNTPRNYVHNLSDKTYVQSKIYQEFYYGIIYIAKEGHHIKIVVFLSVFGINVICKQKDKFIINRPIQKFICCFQGIPPIFMQEVIILKQKGMNFSSLPQGLVKGPFPNEKYSKIMQNSQNFHSYPLILIPNLSNLDYKG